MKYPQKINNTLQTEISRPKQELLAATNSSKALEVRSPSDLEIKAIKKTNSQSLNLYWVLFFAVSVIGAITYTFITAKPNEPQVVKREVHKIYEKVEIRSREPAAARTDYASNVNYFEKSEIRNKINQRYEVLRQNLWTELSNKRSEAQKKDHNFYYSEDYVELGAIYDKKHLLLRGEKALELCEKIGEDCDRAQEFLAFKQKNSITSN